MPSAGALFPPVVTAIRGTITPGVSPHEICTNTLIEIATGKLTAPTVVTRGRTDRLNQCLFCRCVVTMIELIKMNLALVWQYTFHMYRLIKRYV